MDKRTLGYLSLGGILVLMIVVASGSRGIPSEVKAMVQVETSNFARAEDSVDSAKKEILAAFSGDPDLFKSDAFQTTGRKMLDEAEQKLLTGRAELDRIGALVDEGQKDSVNEIESGLGLVRSVRTFAVGGSAELLATVQQRVDFKRNLPANLQRMEKAHAAILAADINGAERLAQKAADDWPAKKINLEDRISRLRQRVSEAGQAWSNAQAEANRGSDIDYSAVSAASLILTSVFDDVTQTVSTFPGLVDQFYWSWENVLVDMEIREGGTIAFLHTYQQIRTHITDVASKENETTSEKSTVEVSKSKYDSMEKNLGMTVQRKDAGRYDSEAESAVQPAGLGYIASPSQGRNQYGRWEQRSGGNFWIFYGQYALMRDLFWGRGGYRPMHHTRWNDYDNSRRAGRTYYGRNSSGGQQYGSKGTASSSRYSGSKYVKSGGYKNSKYMKSGGSYKGSNYASRTNRSASRGGRTSRSRGSGSRGRGGK